MEITVSMAWAGSPLAPDAEIRVGDGCVVRGLDGKVIEGASVESIKPQPDGRLLVTLKLPEGEPLPYEEIRAEELCVGDEVWTWDLSDTLGKVNGLPIRRPQYVRPNLVRWVMDIPTNRGQLERPATELVRIKPREEGQANA